MNNEKRDGTEEDEEGPPPEKKVAKTPENNDDKSNWMWHLWPIPFTHDLYKLFYQKSFTIAGFHKMPIRQGSKIETMKILLEDQFSIGFHLVVILRILFICTKRKLNVFLLKS